MKNVWWNIAWWGWRERSSKRHQLRNWKINMKKLSFTVLNLPGIMSYGVLDIYYKAEVRVPCSPPAMECTCPSSLLKGWMLKWKAKHNEYLLFTMVIKMLLFRKACVCGVLGTSKSFHMNIAKCGKRWRSGQWEWRQGEGFRITLNQSNVLNPESWRCTWWT